MNKILVKCLLVAVVLLGGAVWLQYRYTVRLKSERDRYLSNTTALLSEVKRMQVDSATMALDAKTLQLTLDEYKRFRAETFIFVERQLQGFRIEGHRCRIHLHALHLREQSCGVRQVAVTLGLQTDSIPILEPYGTSEQHDGNQQTFDKNLIHKTPNFRG